MHNAFKQTITLDGNHKELPDDVADDISNGLWPNRELGDNDTVTLDTTDEDNCEQYPALCEFIISNGLTECQINYGW